MCGKKLLSSHSSKRLRLRGLSMEKEGGDEVHQEPVQEAVGQQHDVISASEGQKIVKRPSRPRRWVQKGPEGDLVISLKPRREAEPSRKAQPSGEAAHKAEVRLRPIKDLSKRKQTPVSELGLEREPPKERWVAVKKAESELRESDQDIFSSGDKYEPSKKEQKEYREEMEEDLEEQQKENGCTRGQSSGPRLE